MLFYIKDKMSEEKYSNSIIYTITNENFPNLVYVGSTINLKDRIRTHKRDCKRYPNRLVYSVINNNWDDWIFNIYESFKCNSVEELKNRETEVIKEIGNLNKNLPYGKKTMKEWYIDNKLKHKENVKEYYLKNREKRLIQMKNYNILKKNLYENIENQEKTDTHI